jgi:hypothetical protein
MMEQNKVNKPYTKYVPMTEETYHKLLWFKNFMTIKLSGITNDVVCEKLGINPDGISKVDLKLEEELMCEMDFEPEFTMSECIDMTIDSVMVEQKTGEVNYIT